MTRYVKAVFSDGTVLTRSSVTRIYSHAYLARGAFDRSPSEVAAWKTAHCEWTKTGFSGSADQAARNMAAETAWMTKRAPASFAEVAAVEPIEAAEYRALNKAGHASTGNARGHVYPANERKTP